MNLESEGSAFESVEENEVSLEKSPRDDENGSKKNGCFSNESDYEFGGHGNSDADASTPDQLGNIVEAVGEEVTLLGGKAHAEDSSLASKGFGLKKWRRIRREIVNDPNVSVESKILKRGLSDTANLTKSQPLAHDIKQSSEDSVISSNKDENIWLIDASTIRRSRSGFEATNNGKHDRRSFIHDENNSGEAQTDEMFHEEVQASYCSENEDHLQENLASNLSSDVKEEKGVNNHSSTVEDPLIESMCILQSIQEALEEEILKLGEIRNVSFSSDYDSIKTSSIVADITALDPGLRESYLSDQSDAGGTKPTYSSSLEFQVLILTQNVNVLESKLKESLGLLDLKDSRIHELETALGSHELPKEESGSTVHLSAEEFRVDYSELEGFFRQKLEAEIEYLVITKMMQNFKVSEAFQHIVLEELETSSERQAQVLNKLVIAESKAAVLKNKADELGNYFGDILGAEETIMMQKRLWKVTLCFCVQFMLLIMVFWFFVSQLLPSSGVTIPT